MNSRQEKMGFKLFRSHRFVLGVALATLLSCIAGMSDAIGFSQTGEFVSFMSGNTTRMAIAFSIHDFSRGIRLAMVIGLFICGNALGAIVARLGRAHKRECLLAYSSLLLAISAGLPAVLGHADTLGLETLAGGALTLDPNMTLTSLVLLIFATSAVNCTVDSVEGVGLSLTFVSGALAKIGRGLGNLLVGERRVDWAVQLAPWGGLVFGAVVGNLLDDRYGRHALWLPATLCLLLVGCFLVTAREWQEGIA
jgi:uncharacterized membrane protein YoaK (UPF0700 family)